MQLTDKHHVECAFNDGDLTYTCTAYYAPQFHALRNEYCRDEEAVIRSLSRCRRWATKGGKSKSQFSKTLDGRFVLKQISRVELVRRA